MIIITGKLHLTTESKLEYMKKALYNKLSPEELKKRLAEESFKRVTVSFYKYVNIDSPIHLRNKLYQAWDNMNCLGRIYIAKEGINAQMNVPEHYWQKFENELRSYSILKDVPFKIAINQENDSFYKLQVKVRNQIVADNLPHGTYNISNVGKHLNAEEWNKAMDEGAIVVDMRNYYESEIGHFKEAQLPKAETFAEELPMVLNNLKGKEDQKVLLYCTGGVRCEKTSAYLKHHGFKDVNQLHGGIIDYARQIKVKNLENKFIGKNFVFDNRLGERISEDIISRCHQCGKLCDTHTNCKNKKCNILFIQCEECATKYHHTCSDNCKEYILSSPERQLKLDFIHNYKPVKRYFCK